MMILITFPFYCAMGLQIPISLLNHYSRHKIEHVGIETLFLGVSLFFHLSFASLLLLCDVPQQYLYQNSCLLTIAIMPLIRWLNSIIAGIGSPCPSGVRDICNMAMCGSPLESKHFFNVHFTNFIHASTVPLL